MCLGCLVAWCETTCDDELKSDIMYCSLADQGNYTDAGTCITYKSKESMAAVTNYFRRTVRVHNPVTRTVVLRITWHPAVMCRRRSVSRGLRGQGHTEGVRALTAELGLFYFMHPWSSMFIHGHPWRI